ncbi:MAG: SPOR domain-containing protein [Pseudomonadota bacterium]
MTAFLALRAGASALALCIVAPLSAAAQFVPAPTPTADALAAQMRLLGSNPRDVYALIAAGELSVKLGDPAAALGFFGRAQAVEPSNMRIAAGRAGALVLLERPGEALRLYDQAERAGVDMTPYLSQRGLAYDLIGQPGYAQRDYRRAMRGGAEDETVRRLALSLGISGRRDEAMTLLDPLLRRSDRGAWRARACILAISGDVAGAQRIAATMMAGGSALSPFFSRLQWLSPADRAFAVHFGEVTGSVARSNDARMAPALAALPVEPVPLPSPVAVVASDAREPTRRNRRTRPGRQPITMAAAIPSPVPVAVLPDPPVQLAQVAVRESVARPGSSADALPPRTVTPATITMAAPAAVTVQPVVATPAPPTAAAARPVVEIVTLPRRQMPQIVAAAPPPPPVSTPAPTPTPAPAPAPTPVAVESVPVGSAPMPTAPDPAPQPVVPAPRPESAAVASPPPEVRTPEVARRNTAVLASIIETIAVPASELDVVAPPPPPTAVRKARVEPVTIDAKKVDPKKADTRKADAKKSEPRKPDPAKADPARWWVQVAGGANAADLGKDWKRLTTKSPAAFRGKSAWTTPLRATNRLLAGPFRTQGEASAFVNLLAKDGASAFAWQSEAGQTIERLSPK